LAARANHDFNSEVSFDAQGEKQSLFVGGDPVPLSKDQLRIVRLANEGDVLTSWGASMRTSHPFRATSGSLFTAITQVGRSATHRTISEADIEKRRSLATQRPFKSRIQFIVG
jgi:hypothetical protein